MVQYRSTYTNPYAAGSTYRITTTARARGSFVDDLRRGDREKWRRPYAIDDESVNGDGKHIMSRTGPSPDENGPHHYQIIHAH